MEDQVIFNGLYGSHLYGLNTPNSDMDYKGVYIPKLGDLVFRNYKDTIENQTKEVDTTFYALPKFISILSKCDTVSMDMIHTPEDFTIKATPLWYKLRSLRSDLYCKNMRGILGYIRTQSSKYGHKVERFKEMKEFYSWLTHTEDSSTVKETTLPEQVKQSGFKFIHYTPEKDNISANIDVCGSRYQLNAQVGYLKSGIKKKIDRYGERTLKGSLSGGDWKSISHAYRVLIQVEEMVDKRDIIFPLVKAEEILNIKLGNLDQDTVMSMISEKYEEVMEKLENSDLPEHNDVSRMKEVIMEEILTNV